MDPDDGQTPEYRAMMQEVAWKHDIVRRFEMIEERLDALERAQHGGEDVTTTKGPQEDAIRRECAALAELLVAKNKAYGDSAINPLRVFSKASAVEQIKVRLDDKLSRLARGTERGAVSEDTERDLCGYLILKRIADALERAQQGGKP